MLEGDQNNVTAEQGKCDQKRSKTVLSSSTESVSKNRSMSQESSFRSPTVYSMKARFMCSFDFALFLRPFQEKRPLKLSARLRASEKKLDLHSATLGQSRCHSPANSGEKRILCFCRHEQIVCSLLTEPNLIFPHDPLMTRFVVAIS
jgi:hypothetical protein